MTRSPLRLLALFGLALMLVTAVPFAALGQGGGDDDDDDGDDRDGLERKVSVESDDEGVEIELKREEGQTEDKVEVAFDFDDAEFEIKHELEEGDNETENKLKVAFESLAEYEDANANGRYDVGERIVSQWRLGADDDDDDDDDRDDDDDGNGNETGEPISGRARWQGAVVDDVTVDNQTGKRITATATIGEAGLFRLRMFVFGDYVDLGGASLEPTSVKFDIDIQEFPYRQDATALALFMETEAKREIEAPDDDEHDDDEEGVATSGVGDLRLVFTWKTNATVDAQDREVHSTLLEAKEEVEDGETKQEREIALSYPRGASIVHDPELKVLNADAEQAEGAPLPALPLMVLVVAAVALGLRRRS